MTRFPVILIIFFSCLVGCTTAEYNSTRQKCIDDSLIKYPEKLKNITVNRTRYETVPDGNVRCTSTPVISTGLEKNVRTHCTQGTRQIAIPYTETSTIDLNYEVRGREIDSCTRYTCIRRYGNSQCEPERLQLGSNASVSTLMTADEIKKVISDANGRLICVGLLEDGTKVRDEFIEDARSDSVTSGLFVRGGGRPVSDSGEWQIVGNSIRIKSTERSNKRYALNYIGKNRYYAYESSGKLYMKMKCR